MPKQPPPSFAADLATYGRHATDCPAETADGPCACGFDQAQLRARGLPPDPHWLQEQLERVCRHLDEARTERDEVFRDLRRAQARIAHLEECAKSVIRPWRRGEPDKVNADALARAMEGTR